MSVAAPARPTHAGSSALTAPRPLRTPDASSPAMMSRRAWWLVALNFLLPGSAQIVAGSRRLGRIGIVTTLALWAALLVALILALVWRTALFWLATNWFVLSAVQIVLIAAIVLWVVLTVDTLRLARLVRVRPAARAGVSIAAILGLVLAGGGAAYGAAVTGAARDGIELIFGQSGPSVPPSDGYYNILLLGADSGDGRDSMRFDSISVVSVNADTGAVTITGIPRDMPYAPFPDDSPMHAPYPSGFEGHGDPACGWGPGVNQLTNAVQVCRDDAGEGLYPDTADRGTTPAVEATKDAAEGILGIEIPYYVFLDMHGFADLIDALGGVDITVEERLPKGGGPAWEGQDAEEWAIGWIEAGPQHMDGDTAQWYARSRYTTDDFDRMKRQRQLQQAILAQFTPETVLFRFQDLMAAGSAMIDTDLPSSMLPYLAELALKAKELPVSTIELTPESGIDEYDPDYADVHALVQETLNPPEPEPEPETEE